MTAKLDPTIEAVLRAAERLTDATRSSAFAQRRSVESRISDLVAAVGLYRERRATPQIVGIGPEWTAIIDQALEYWNRDLTAPHAQIAEIRVALTGTAPGNGGD